MHDEATAITIHETIILAQQIVDTVIHRNAVEVQYFSVIHTHRAGVEPAAVCMSQSQSAQTEHTPGTHLRQPSLPIRCSSAWLPPQRHWAKEIRAERTAHYRAPAAAKRLAKV